MARRKFNPYFPIDPNLPAFNRRTQAGQIDDALKADRLLSMLSNAFGFSPRLPQSES